MAEIRTGPRNAAASLRPRLRAAQVRRHFAIVDVLLVARLAAEPLLGGAERMTGPPAARNAALRERRNEAMKALSCLPRERVGVAREIGGRRRHVGKSCPNRELFRSPNHLIGLVRTCGRRDTDAAA